MPTKRRRFMVNIPPEHEQAVLTRAKQLNRSVANYLEWLVTQDLAAGYYQEAPPDGDLKAAEPEPLGNDGPSVDELAAGKSKRLQQDHGSAPKASPTGGKPRPAPLPASARTRSGTASKRRE